MLINFCVFALSFVSDAHIVSTSNYLSVCLARSLTGWLDFYYYFNYTIYNEPP